MTCPECRREHPAPGALETTPPIPCGRCWAGLSPAAKAPYLYALRTSPELAAFKSRDPMPHVGAFSPAALAYVVHLEARASQTRSEDV